MESEKKNKFSEGVGKKILDALKTNNDAESESEEYNYQTNIYHEPSSEYEYKHEYKNYTEEYEVSIEAKEQSAVNKSSSDVDILINLVTKLPPGVTKQTGAQIIRHTMEAMGISMNKVLANAQRAQEEMEQDIKNNINGIEEYKSKIKRLDEDIQNLRKKSLSLEDIISLFILSETKK